MRLLVQGCLILGLCLLSSVAAAIQVDTVAQAWSGCQARLETTTYEYAACFHYPESNYVHFANQSWNSPGPGVSYQYLQGCPGDEEFDTSTGACESPAPPPCEAPNYTDPDTGECLSPKEPEECQENGLAHDPQTQQCVEECEHGMLNGACLPPPEDNDECTSDSPDYRGEVVLGYGQSPIPACGNFDQCEGTGGSVGFVNGKLRCLPDDYGAPECKGDTISVIDEYGFVCEPLTNQPEEPETPEEPNTDTDGDGEPDEYQEKNDPESLDKGLNKVRDAIEEGNAKTDKSNQHLKNIENAVKGIADNVSSLEQMGKNGELAGGGGGSSEAGEGLKNEAGEDYLGDLADIKQNTKDTADTLTEIKDGPEGGYNTDGLGDAPTFSESTERLQLAITNNPTIQAVTTVPSIASNNTCPVWTIPATDFWQAMPIDSHCQILEDHRGLLSLLFIAVWTLAAVFVFLRA